MSKLNNPVTIASYSRNCNFYPIASGNFEFQFGVALTVVIIAGYVQKITARKDIDVMEDLDNGRPP